MSNYQSLLENVTQNPLASELGKTLHGLLIYTGSQHNVDLSNYSTVLIDFKHIIESGNQFNLNTLIDRVIAARKPLILLNVHDGKYLSKMLGVGLEGSCIIVRAYTDYNAIDVLGLFKGDILYDCGQSQVNQDADGSRSFNIQDTNCLENSASQCQDTFTNLSIVNQARTIESTLSSDFVVPQEFSCTPLGSTPTDLPQNQFKLTYLNINGKWNLTDQQVTNNSVVMEISLIASYNPPYKYLRIRSMGAGFNPANGGEMQSNNTYDRGYFQSRMKIHMQPNTDKLTALSTDPKNINHQTQYTTSSSFSVGVDVSKNPSFNSSYTISESTTTVVSDFNIYNNGAGVMADWDFVLGMTENSIWDIFSEPFMKKGQVRSLPELATKNLQAVTEAVWYANSTLNEAIGVQLYWKVDHYRCWVTGDWTEYCKHYSHKWVTLGYKDTPVYIDFSSVHA